MTTIDHVVMYSSDAEATIVFYRDALGYEIVGESEWRAGERPTFRIQLNAHQFINVHPPARELHPRAAAATPGGLDLCILVQDALEAVLEHLAGRDVHAELGPVDRTTATGSRSRSIYLRDPDQNLIELMSAEPR